MMLTPVVTQATASAPSRAVVPPPSTILLFWASWCAPCRAEVADIATLERAAAPMRVVVVPVEPRSAWRGLLRSVRADQIYLPLEGGLTLMQRLTGGSAASLPVSIATDSERRICGVHRVAVTRAIIEHWRDRCG